MPYIPQYEGRYFEPFFGGGAMYFHIEPERAVINDINTKLMDFYRAVQQNYQHLSKELAMIEEIYSNNRADYEALKQQHPDERVVDKNEALYYNMRDMYNGLKEPKYSDAALYYFINKTSYSGMIRLRDMYNGLKEPKYSDAALYYFINKTSYSGMIRYNTKGEYNVPYGRYKHLNTSLLSEHHHYLLLNTDIYNSDYKNIFDLTENNDFVFLDPPYDCIFSDYGNEEYRDGFSEENHRKLANDFQNLNCKAMLVIGATSLTRELYRGSIKAEYDKNYSVNIRNRFHAEAVHLIVTNY